MDAMWLGQGHAGGQLCSKGPLCSQARSAPLDAEVTRSCLDRSVWTGACSSTAADSCRPSFRAARAVFSALSIAAVASAVRRRNRCSSRVMAKAQLQDDLQLRTSIWTLLDLQPGAPKEEIRKSYKKFIRSMHPDVVGEYTTEMTEQFTKVTKAYREIMKANEDLFWYERFAARVDYINNMRERAWRARRRARRRVLEEKMALQMAAKRKAEEEAEKAPWRLPTITEFLGYSVASILTAIGAIFAALIVWLICKQYIFEDY